MIKAAIVGYGNIGKAVLEALHAADDLRSLVSFAVRSAQHMHLSFLGLKLWMILPSFR